MWRDYPEKILLSVKKPSRYLGREPFFPYKDWEKAELRLCLAYPDLYEVGRSHLGITLLAGIVNSKRLYLCDFAFSVAPDLEKELKRAGIPLLSLNYRKPLRKFDVLGLSYAYELLATGIFQILELSGIPFRAEERGEGYPFILGGGPCVGNPEPVAEIFDAMVIGDAEEALIEVLEVVREAKKEAVSKEDILKELLKIEGVYVPLFKNRVKRRVYLFERAFNGNSFSLPTIPLAHDRVSIEVSRGCTRSCRFCEAGFYYRPVREKTPESILKETKLALSLTGYREASLMSLSLGDYTALEELVSLFEEVFYRDPQKEYVFSLPSLRVGSLTPRILSFLKKGRTSTLTFALEAGSERLRRVINKMINLEELYRDLSLAKEYGFHRVKLYFMLGLPTEREEDLEEMVSLYRDLKRTFKRIDFTFSASIFVPKPHTPFQWERQITIEEAREKIKYLREKLKSAFKYHNPEQSFLEGVLSRGGRELFPYLQEVYLAGARLDSWKDYFNLSPWIKVAERRSMALHVYLKERTVEEPLPWEHIDLGVERGFLIEERQRAYSGKYTEDCRFSRCTQCGVCKKPVGNRLVQREEKILNTINFLEKKDILEADKGQVDFWYEIRFDKVGPAKMLSQLEVLRLIELVLRRLGFKLAYTQGYNPRPKFVVDQAPPVGIEVKGAYLALALRERVFEKQLAPLEIYEGLRFISARFHGEKKPPKRHFNYYYEVKIKSTRAKDLISVLQLPQEYGIEIKETPKGILLRFLESERSLLRFLKENLGLTNPLTLLEISQIYL